jgi:enolase
VTATKIADVFAWEALDSRGRPTVAARVTLVGGASGRALAPSGASKGAHEAHERRDGGVRYGGWGVTGAVNAVNGPIADAVIGLDATDRRNLDAAMEALDGEPSLGRLGANAILSVSLAALLAGAEASGQPLWRILNGGVAPLLPLPMVNIFSGGAHARGLLDIQDILVIPLAADSFAQGIEWVAGVRSAAADLLSAQGLSSALVADEGGLAGALKDNEAALQLVTAGIERAGFRPGEDIGIAVDLASNQIFHDGRYRLALDGVELTAAEWIGLLAQWCASYPIVSLEDVVGEDQWDDWKAASTILGEDRQLLGDDLFATNAARLARGIEAGIANAVLVKVNQAGAVSRAEDVFAMARAAGYATVISARSGDTEDSWLADLAVGWSAGQIKVGSTHRSERTAKWNRLLEIEADRRNQARFAGRRALSRGNASDRKARTQSV